MGIATAHKSYFIFILIIHFAGYRKAQTVKICLGSVEVSAALATNLH